VLEKRKKKKSFLESHSEALERRKNQVEFEKGGLPEDPAEKKIWAEGQRNGKARSPCLKRKRKRKKRIHINRLRPERIAGRSRKKSGALPTSSSERGGRADPILPSWFEKGKGLAHHLYVPKRRGMEEKSRTLSVKS